METLFSGKYGYRGYHDCVAVCNLEVLKGKRGTVVTATEIAENEGTSVTNCAEKIASEIVKQYNIPTHRLTWIEHYGPMSYRGGHRKDEYQLVEFSWAGRTAMHPTWQPMTSEQVEELKQNIW